MSVEAVSNLRGNVAEEEGLVHRLLGRLCVGSRDLERMSRVGGESQPTGPSSAHWHPSHVGRLVLTMCPLSYPLLK